MNPCFLDTCAVIDLMAGRQTAQDALVNFDHLLISYVVLGELLLGCKRSPNPETEFSNLRKLLLNNTWVGADIPTSVATHVWPRSWRPVANVFRKTISGSRLFVCDAIFRWCRATRISRGCQDCNGPSIDRSRISIVTKSARGSVFLRTPNPRTSPRPN